MKIRIIGKGLPKAQDAGQFPIKNSVSINGTIYFEGEPGYAEAKQEAAKMKEENSAFSSYINSRMQPGISNRVNDMKSFIPKMPKLNFKPFANSGQAAASINPFTQTATTPAPIATIPASTATSTTPKRFWHSEWDDEEFDTDPAGQFYQPYQTSQPAVQPQSNTLAQAANWYSKNIGNPVEKAFEGLDKTVGYANFATQLFNGYKKKQDFDKRSRRFTSTDSLFPEVTSEMSGNRGDYVVSGSRFGEFRPDEYVVNKGMYTGQFQPRMAQYGGGIIPDELVLPVDQVQLSTALVNPMTTGEAYTNSENNTAPAPMSSAGVNPVAEQTWQEVSSQFQGVKHLGIWGDKRHQKTKSDHNTGDALDIGIQGAEQGQQIAQKLIGEAQDKNIKYIIWNKQIWNPSVSNSWRPYNGDNPHTSHVHVSFNRASGGESGEIALSNNNPLNIHHGEFASNYGGVQGSKDSGGYVSKFPDFETGIKAAKDLLFGSDYSNLTISQARNKWVSGNPNTSNNSTSDIVKSMGSDKVLKDLSNEEREKLIKQFARWEGKQAYNKISGMKLYADGGTAMQYESGGVYELTEDQIKNILASGGEVEFL